MSVPVGRGSNTLDAEGKKKAKEGVGQTQAPHLLFSLIFYDRRAAFETNSPNLQQDSLWSLISLFAAPELSFTAAPD